MQWMKYLMKNPAFPCYRTRRVSSQLTDPEYGMPHQSDSLPNYCLLVTRWNHSGWTEMKSLHLWTVIEAVKLVYPDCSSSLRPVILPQQPDWHNSATENGMGCKVSSHEVIPWDSPTDCLLMVVWNKEA